MRTYKVMFAAALTLALVATGGVTTESEALADPPPAFGPIADKSFHFYPGTNLEIAQGTCENGDVLKIRGPGLGNAKSHDVTPRTDSYPNTQNRDKYGCEAPDCFQLWARVNGKDSTGPRTVTLKSADGRTVTTTFTVTPNAGRCDYKKGGGSK